MGLPGRLGGEDPDTDDEVCLFQSHGLSANVVSMLFPMRQTRGRPGAAAKRASSMVDQDLPTARHRGCLAQQHDDDDEDDDEDDDDDDDDDG